MNIRIMGLLGAGLLVATTASAHHGFGNFAMNEDVELTGVITRLDFVNGRPEGLDVFIKGRKK